ncbi:STAM-binding protein isoform X2 [Vigna radiata var. radiata]|uniref:STAM-binding protein isoform X2 n=1 Tax=Vigna radiata var. radiata TaxID=3916 RepID=A0A3Q0EKC6_VIGRR|nr:STAM-binding protein isoform X2 [Vigna radiata var. radiata]
MKFINIFALSKKVDIFIVDSVADSIKGARASQQLNHSSQLIKEKLYWSKMYKQSNEEQSVSNNRKVGNCDAAESSFQSMSVDDVDPSGGSSFQLRNLSCCSLVCKPSATKTANRYFMLHKVTQSWPSPALCFVERVPQDAQSSHVTVFNSGDGSSKSDNESTSSKSMRDVHISMRLMEDFLDLAKENTEKDLETCGILGAYLEKGTLYMTTLIIPKQESASNSCQATNEEEVFKILNERSLYPVGWIHTHPSQSCFMSSVDLHTQYSYQMMIPEAFAIVLAPNDKLRRQDFIHTKNQIMATLCMSTAPMCTETLI